MEITILSGKGGTGKTTLAAGLGEIFKDSIKVDCDVDAANLYLYYNGKVKSKEKFYSGKIANINLDKCHRCHKCVINCHFEAIKNYRVDDLKCEGCGVCKLVCPFDAIELIDNNIADIIELKLNNGFLVMADMKIGSDGSGKLVVELRERAKKYNGIIIVDGSPGIGCPVISSITGTDLVLIVTEPTMSGLGDLKRILKLVISFKIKKYVCINKYDINLIITEEIKQFCNKNDIEIIGQIPFDSTVIKSVNNLKPIVLYEESPAGIEIKEIANRIKKIMRRNFMKVAIATDQNKCSDHFGHCQGFKIYDIVNGIIKNEEFINNPGHKPGFLPVYLSGRGINVIISSGMGSTAQDLFRNESIEVIVGCQGNFEKIINDYINGNLVSDQSICDKHEFDGNCNN